MVSCLKHVACLWLGGRASAQYGRGRPAGWSQKGFIMPCRFRVQVTDASWVYRQVNILIRMLVFALVFVFEVVIGCVGYCA